MTRGISEATDMHGVTHHIIGDVRFVYLPKRRRRRNPAKRGYYVTQDACCWWCTEQPIPVNMRAAPGKTVDCMTCLVNPPEESKPKPFKTATGRLSSRTIMMSTPRSRETNIFDANARSIRSVFKHHIGRRR